MLKLPYGISSFEKVTQEGYYARHHIYPDELLDTNITSDYGKLRELFRVELFIVSMRPTGAM